MKINMGFIKYFWKKNKYTLLEFAIWIMLFQLLPDKMIALTSVFNVIAIIALLIVSLASTLALVNEYRIWRDYNDSTRN